MYSRSTFGINIKLIRIINVHQPLLPCIQITNGRTRNVKLIKLIINSSWQWTLSWAQHRHNLYFSLYDFRNSLQKSIWVVTWPTWPSLGTRSPTRVKCLGMCSEHRHVVQLWIIDWTWYSCCSHSGIGARTASTNGPLPLTASLDPSSWR